jgi:Family of unknown function (DUF6132)
LDGSAGGGCIGDGSFDSLIHKIQLSSDQTEFLELLNRCNLPTIMKKWLSKNKLILIGTILGAVAGYFYYRFIGCSNGTCLISSRPLNSTVYFAVLGAILFSLFKRKTGGEAK